MKRNIRVGSSTGRNIKRCKKKFCMWLRIIRFTFDTKSIKRLRYGWIGSEIRMLTTNIWIWIYFQFISFYCSFSMCQDFYCCIKRKIEIILMWNFMMAIKTLSITIAIKKLICIMIYFIAEMHFFMPSIICLRPFCAPELIVSSREFCIP